MVSVEDLLKTERGRALVMRCHGLEFVHAYHNIEKISLPPAPEASPPKEEVEEQEAD